MSEQDGSELQYDVSELPIEDFFHYTPSLALACLALSLYILVSAAARLPPPTGSRCCVAARCAATQSPASCCKCLQMPEPCSLPPMVPDLQPPNPPATAAPPLQAAAVIGVMTERRKAYRFMHTVTVTGLFEAAGYSALIYAIQQTGRSNIFNA